MGYRGRSAIVAMIAIVLAYGCYFCWSMRPGHGAGAVLGALTATVAGLAIVLIALETGLAICDRHAGRRSDERDALVAAFAARNGYYALLCCLWCAPLVPLFATPIQTANALVAMLVAAELVHFGSRMVYDQRSPMA